MENKYAGVNNVNCYMKNKNVTVVTIDCAVYEDGEIVHKLLSVEKDDEATMLVSRLAELVASKNGYKVGE